MRIIIQQSKNMAKALLRSCLIWEYLHSIYYLHVDTFTIVKYQKKGFNNCFVNG